jgi:hypothetical protein
LGRASGSAAIDAGAAVEVRFTASDPGHGDLRCKLIAYSPGTHPGSDVAAEVVRLHLEIILRGTAIVTALTAWRSRIFTNHVRCLQVSRQH